MSSMSRCSRDAVYEKALNLVSGILSLTDQMPGLGRARQPSRQCTTLGTTPKRIKKSVKFPRGKSKIGFMIRNLEIKALCLTWQLARTPRPTPRQRVDGV